MSRIDQSVLPKFTEVLTDRFLLRPLTVCDVTDRYADWLSDQATSQYISAAASKPNLADLRQYVLERSDRADVLFLGIFEKTTWRHIGNIKFEPLCTELGYATMGILIGEADWRGKGAAAEVLSGCAEWLCQHRSIRQIVLGVSRANTAAICAYKKVGFVEEATEFNPPQQPDAVMMIWHLNPLPL